MPGAVEKPPLGIPRPAGSPGTPGSQAASAEAPLVSGDMPSAVEKPPLSRQGTMVRYVLEASRVGVSTNELGGTTTPSWTVRYDLDSSTGVTANRGSLIRRAPLAVVDVKLGTVAATTPETPNGVASRAANARAATGLLERWNMRSAARVRVVTISVHLDLELVRLGGRVARPLG